MQDAGGPFVIYVYMPKSCVRFSRLPALQSLSVTGSLWWIAVVIFFPFFIVIVKILSQAICSLLGKALVLLSVPIACSRICAVAAFDGDHWIA